MERYPVIPTHQKTGILCGATHLGEKPLSPCLPRAFRGQGKPPKGFEPSWPWYPYASPGKSEICKTTPGTASLLGWRTSVGAPSFSSMADSEHEPRSEPAPQSPPQVFERPPVRYDDYKEWSVARASCASLHPRWEQLKDEANIALKEGDTERAIAGYTKALKVADPDVFVTGLFAALADASPRCMPSADRLVGAQQDIAPFIRQHVGGPAANDRSRDYCSCTSRRVGPANKPDSRSRSC